MPLLIVCGYPCSGKSRQAEQLAAFIREKCPGRPVEIIQEETLGISRHQAYANAQEEKQARSMFISAVERKLNRETIVIADSLNYIKGYRYQLYCIARAAGTPHCLLWCVAGREGCLLRNAARLASTGAGYDEAIMRELFDRFEEPNNQARWDTPLFTVGIEEEEDKNTEWNELLAALLGTAARPPSMATATKGGTSGELLLLLDQITQQVVEQAMKAIRLQGPPPIHIEIEGVEAIVRRPTTMGDLQRLRSQFIHMNRLHPINALDKANARRLFAQYLAKNL